MHMAGHPLNTISTILTQLHMRQLILTLCLLVIASSGRADDQTVGLVLSGGGSKGIAHIGFIQALEENEIPIDCITGTSMGAIVGALYAIGYSPRDMMELLKSPDFMDWATGSTPVKERYLYNQPRQTPEWLGINFDTGDSAMMAGIFPTRLINPQPMNEAFMEIFSPAVGAANSDFNRLFVPYRAIASDVYRHKKVVFSRGQLPLAVRASMSFPLVFQPIMVDGTLLYDGGLYDVYPVDVMMEDFNPDRVIGVDVSTPNTPPGLNDLVSQVENMVMSGYLPKFPDDKGVNVVMDLSRFGLTNWDAATEIYRLGYQRGLALADSLKQRISARRSVTEVDRRRHEFRDKIRQMKFRSVRVSDTDPGKAEFIRHTFLGGHSLPLTQEQARSGFYRVTETGRMRNLVPHAAYDSVSGMFDLDLHADVSKDFKAGVGGYVTSGTQSLLYAGLHYSALDFHKPMADLGGWAGQSYLAVSGRVGYELKTGLPQRLWLTATASRERFDEREKMFYDFSSPAFNIGSEISAVASWEMAAGRHGTLEASLGYGHLTESYRAPLPFSPELPRQRVIRDLGRARLIWHRSALDSEYLPTSGWEVEAEVSGYFGKRRMRLADDDGSTTPAWVTGYARAVNYFNLSRKITLGAGVTALYSTQKLTTDYTSSLVMASAYQPFSWMESTFNPAWRTNRFVAVELTPIWKVSNLFQLRLDGRWYVPMQRILPAEGHGARYGHWFGSSDFVGEFSAAMKLPFGAVRAYVHYTTSHFDHWGAGISLGMLLKAPRFMR